ncbi:zinc finger protein Elbow [Nasonia vitripennis]|uniref:C2H2-type domain-containing protein n=1 Tax=Nasonia vitripennis TaxID=7425 RepID=A0A7M7GGF7_NASVI|nr:zinc finger protein Elbow [Nasonia vitripennis]
MLTSNANQYLRPEYLTPLPTTLDAKKSPLALLAQTCSQIGIDPPSSKPLLQVSPDKSGKSSGKSDARDKSSPGTGHSSTPSGTATYSPPTSEGAKSSSFKPYESCISRDKDASPEQPQQQRVPSTHSASGSSSNRSRTPGNKRCSSNQSASSSGGRAMTPQGRKSSTPSNEPTASSGGSNPRESPSSRLAATSSPSAPKAAYSPAQSHEYSLAGFRPSPMSLISATSAGASTTTTPSAAYGLPYPGQLPPLDAMTASSLMSQHHAAAAALKNGLASHPYISYARMKTPSGGDTLVPVCRDPYCNGCQLNSHLLASTSTASGVNGGKLPVTSQAGPCPAGCAQCDHKPSAAAAAAAAQLAAASSPYAAYAHAQLVALAAASQMHPYVCNWIGSDAAYCGKRFSTSDELLQHFRGHTGQPSAESAAGATAATTAAALSLLTPPGLGPGHPLLSRTYPTPPLSPLATARYHPYGKPYAGPPGLSTLGLPLPPPPHPAGLPPYFSPYASLYANSRLGAASGMHP